MPQLSNNLIGKNALMLVLSDEEPRSTGSFPLDALKWKYCAGKVGSMEFHALYHAIIEALEGVTRGQMQLGAVLRTVGLRFSIVRGNPYDNVEEGEWIAVAFYGTIGAPVKGLEHEAVGLGISHT